MEGSVLMETKSFSLWDIFTFFVTGVIIIVNISFYVDFDLMGFIDKQNILKSEIAIGIYWLIVTYTLGVIFEPISNLLFRILKYLYSYIKPLAGRHSKLILENGRLNVAVKQLLKKNDEFQDDGDNIYDVFQIAKAYVQQHAKEANFMIYLSRYGFYRNLTVILLINIFIFIAKYFDTIALPNNIYLLILLVVLHFIVYKRALEFFYYTGNEVLRIFLLTYKKDLIA